MHQIAMLLRRKLGAQARKVPTRQLPNLVVRLASRFQPELREMLPELGHVKQIRNDKARTELGWQPRPAEETSLDAGRSLLSLSRAC
jgi:dihydroflavonol-4-reductase